VHLADDWQYSRGVAVAEDVARHGVPLPAAGALTSDFLRGRGHLGDRNLLVDQQVQQNADTLRRTSLAIAPSADGSHVMTEQLAGLLVVEAELVLFVGRAY
jgi:hypothetical protein